jgi:hypothetical protein
MAMRHENMIISAIQETPCDCEEELIMYILDLWMCGHIPLPFLKDYVKECCPESYEKIMEIFAQITGPAAPPLPNQPSKNEWFITNVPIRQTFYIKKEILNAIFLSEDNRKKFFYYLKTSSYSIICLKPDSIL